MPEKITFGVNCGCRACHPTNNGIKALMVQGKLCIHSIQLCTSWDTSLPPGTFGAFFKDQSKIRRRSFECFLQLFKVTSSVLCQTIQKLPPPLNAFSFCLMGITTLAPYLAVFPKDLGFLEQYFTRWAPYLSLNLHLQYQHQHINGKTQTYFYRVVPDYLL